MQPNAPFYTILAVSNEWLQFTCQERDKIVGKSVLEVYPENQEAITASNPSNLIGFLKNALETKKPNTIPVLRYMVPGAGGAFEARYWSANNKLITDQAGEVCYIIHSIQDIERMQQE